MRRSINYLLVTCLVFLTACGYRTAPVPYDLPDKNIQTVSHAKLNAQGDTWIFRWTIPEGQSIDHPAEVDKSLQIDASNDISRANKPNISIFRVNIFKTSGECSLCKPESLGHFLIDLKNNKIEPVFSKNITLPMTQQFFITGIGHFRFDLPAIFFRDNGLTERCFYTVDYILTGGLLSFPSERVYPLDFKVIPLPEVRVQMSASHDQPMEMKPCSNDCEKTQPERFLLLQWEPQRETLRHILQEDGRYTEQIIYYGVNFYNISKQSSDEQETVKHNPFLNSEQLVNPEPLLYGSFSLLNFQGQLLARHVDRFGNESRSIPVFSEKD